MNNCPDCGFSNPEKTIHCLKCSTPLPGMDPRCGLSTYGGTCVGQVLQMRYLISNELESDFTGVKFLAEDTETGRNVLIWALPKSLLKDHQKISELSNISISFKPVAGEYAPSFFIEKNTSYFVIQAFPVNSDDHSKTAENLTIEKLTAELNWAKEKFEAYIETMQKAKQQCNEFKHKHEQLESKLKEQSDRTTAELEEIQKQLQNEEKAKIQAEKKIYELEEENKQQRTTAIQTEQLLKDKLDRMIQESETARHAKQEMQNQCNAYRETITELNSKLAEIEASLNENKKQAHSEHESNKKIDALNAELLEKQDLYTNLIDEIQGKLDDEIKSRKTIQTKCKEYETKIEQLQTYIELIEKSNSLESQESNQKTGPLFHKNEYLVIDKSKKKLDFLSLLIKQRFIFYIVILLLVIMGIFSFKIFKHKHISSATEDSQENLKTMHIDQETSESLPRWLQVAVDFEKANDFDSAAQLYLQTAQEGDPLGMYLLATAYYTGKGLDQNLDMALAWFTKASNAGHADAMFDLGSLYYSGTVIQRDLNKAEELFLKSAQLGNPLAMYNIGRLYHDQKDPQAIQWYEKSAQKGIDLAINQLAQIYCIGDIAEKDLTKGAYYYQQSAQLGNQNAMYNLALFYLNGMGVEKDFQKAVQWFRKAAQKNDPDAMYQLGLMLEEGTIIKKDTKKAFEWYHRAAETGHQAAQQKISKSTTIDS